MIVKKFQAQTETDAILKAREELGSKAIVLNVKTLKQRGIFRLFKKDLIEVTAALEEEEFVNDINKSKPLVGGRESSYSTAANTISNTNNTSASRLNLVADESISINPEAAVIEQKLDSLHSLLQNQMETVSHAKPEMETDIVKADTVNGETVVKERENTNLKFLNLISSKMVDNEVDERFVSQIISDIENSLKKESNIDSILSAVYQKIILKLGEPRTIKLGDKPKVVFFIGPTGVGKTTTIAKIASKFKIEEYARVAFITSDTYRIAAVEQLNTYASIIDSPVSVVYTADELEESLNEYRNYDLIMVDTAGRSHKSQEQMSELNELLAKVEDMKDDFDVEIYLTLSVTTKYKDLIDITKRYNDIDNWAVIFTKLDETCALGNILNIRMLTDAALSYVTSGQNVPDDIEMINAQALAKQLLGGNV